MFTIIHCDNCKKSGMFDLEFKFNLESHSCEKCHHHTMESWTYYFCDIVCLMDWLYQYEIKEKGFPCRDCRDMNGIPTGWRSGFESNGKCSTCNGTMRIKGHRLQEWETRKLTSEEA